MKKLLTNLFDPFKYSQLILIYFQLHDLKQLFLFNNIICQDGYMISSIPILRQ